MIGQLSMKRINFLVLYLGQPLSKMCQFDNEDVQVARFSSFSALNICQIWNFLGMFQCFTLANDMTLASFRLSPCGPCHYNK